MILHNLLMLRVLCVISCIRVNVKLPSVEVRYKNLCVEAECEVVPGKPLPTLWNSVVSTLSSVSMVFISCLSLLSDPILLNELNRVMSAMNLMMTLLNRCAKRHYYATLKNPRYVF